LALRFPAGSKRRVQRYSRSTLTTTFVAAAHNGQPRNYFLFDQFQFALPPDWNAIILLRKVGIGPVGARPFDKRELPP
jgi:hypothetical protein